MIHHQSIQVLDLGSGTGLVSESFLRAFDHSFELHLVDPDPSMIQESKDRLKSQVKIKSWTQSGAEQLPFNDESVDLALIGSAWHWMEHARVIHELMRVLRSGGGVFIFEYQFPKSPMHIDLNQWIKTKFNTEWKPPTQTPRGTLKELTEGLRSHPLFCQDRTIEMVFERSHTLDELVGVIVSQSRFQHFKKTLTEAALNEELEKIKRNLGQWMIAESDRFHYPYEGYFFRKRL